MDPCFAEYAKCYDLIYQDKDYPREAAYVSALITAQLPRAPGELSVLDLACGTGRHALEMSRLGYAVTGSDASADMIEMARQRAQAAGAAIDYFAESFQTCDVLGGRYDVVTAMFAAINYLTDRRDLRRTLDNVRKLLKPGGLFIFDFWNGNAVLSDYSPVRVKRGREAGRLVQRISQTVLDRLSHVATINFEFMLIEDGCVKREFSEVHHVRYFFPQEMMDLLAESGFEVLKRCPFMQPDQALGEQDWNVTIVAKPCA